MRSTIISESPQARAISRSNKLPKPSILKEVDTYLHIKIRGHNDQPLFIETSDYQYFEFLFHLNLSDNTGDQEIYGRIYPDFHHHIELLCYSLLENRLYMLLHQKTAMATVDFLQAILQRYARYFRLKYERTGPVFDPAQRIARIRSQRDFDHVSRSIHLSPHRWERYRYSSLHHYLNEDSPEWLAVDSVLSRFTNRLAYLAFLKNYEHYQENLKAA